MPIYKPTELWAFLNSLGITPKKALSQNFLIDGNIIRKIVATAQVKENDVVLEIGPGPGSLTEALLEKKATVIAVEMDKTLAPALERLKSEDNKIQIVCEDIMNVDLEKLLKPHLKIGQKAKVIANLPYHITTPILSHLVQRIDLFESVVVMVQDEVARRFVALPNTKDYSSFTVFLNFYCDVEYAFQVSKNCFYPVPKVNSAVTRLVLKQSPSVDENLFFQMTRTAFGQRRKMVRSTLKDLYDPETLTDALQKIGLDPKVRPEALSLNAWLELFKNLN